MAFFKTQTDKDSIKESSFEYIKEGGIYDVTIKFLSVKQNKHGARSLDFNVDYKGSNTTFYGLKLDNNDGSPNYQRNLFNKLCVIAGIEEVDNPVDREHKVGKDQKLQNFAVLDQFDDMNVKVRVVFIYSKYEGEIREQREIKNFYRYEDGATAGEIVNGLVAGTQLGKDIILGAKPVYKDGLTEQEVEEWKASQSKADKPAEPANKPAAKNPFQAQ